MKTEFFAEAVLRAKENRDVLMSKEIRDAVRRGKRNQSYSTSMGHYESSYDTMRGSAQEKGMAATIISKGAAQSKRSLAQAASEKAIRGPIPALQIQHLSAKHHDEDTGQPPCEGDDGEGQTRSPEKRTRGSIKSFAALASQSDTEQKLAPENTLPRGRTLSADSALEQNHVKLLDLETKTTNLQKIVRQQQLQSSAALSPVDMRISGGGAGLAISGSPAMIMVSLGSQGVARSTGRRGVPLSAPVAAEMSEATSSASDEVDAPASVVSLWNRTTPRLDRPWLEELRRRDAQAAQAGLPSRLDSAGARSFVMKPHVKEDQQSSFLTAGMSLKELRLGVAGQRPIVRPASAADYGSEEDNVGQGAGRRGYEENGVHGVQVGVSGGEIVSATIGHLSETGAEADDSKRRRMTDVVSGSNPAEADDSPGMISRDTARSVSVSFNAMKGRLSVF
jgi:hypothetical protein